VALTKGERRKTKVDTNEDGGKQKRNGRQGWVWRRRSWRRFNGR